MERGFVAQESVDRRTWHEREFLWRRIAIEPTTEVGTDDAIADAKTCSTRADSDDLARAIRASDWRIVARERIVTARDHQVAIVERYGADRYPHIVCTERRACTLDPLERLLTSTGIDSIRSHS